MTYKFWIQCVLDDGSNYDKYVCYHHVPSPCPSPSMVVDIHRPADGSGYTNGALTNFSFYTYSDVAVTSCSYNLNGAPSVFLPGGPFSGGETDVDFSPIIGNNTLSVQCTDRNGKVAADTVKFEICGPGEYWEGDPINDCKTLRPACTITPFRGTTLEKIKNAIMKYQQVKIIHF